MPALYTLGNMQLVDASADHPDDFQHVPLEEKRVIIIHHTATPPTMTVKTLYEAHKKYGGIGYNALVYPNGEAWYVGDWNTSRAGAAQVSTLNWQAYHLAFVGNYDNGTPPAVATNTMRSLLANLQYARGLKLPVVPHCLFNVDADAARHVWNTECPGLTWRYWWGRIVG